MKFYIYVIIVFSFLSACKQATPIKEVLNQSTKISFPQTLDRIKFCKYSEVYDSVKLVKLQTNKESLIGRIDKILVQNGNFFILDQVERKAVLEFDANGKFLRKFGKVGNGSGEYGSPNDMTVNAQGLTIWDSQVNKFITYDLNGKFIKEVKSRSSAKSGVMLNADAFALYLDIGIDAANSNEKFDFKIIDNAGKVIHTGFEKKDKSFSKGSFFFNQSGNETLLSPGYSNAIYAVHKDEIVKKYTIDFGKHEMPASFPEKYTSVRKFEKGLKESNYVALLSYLETPAYLNFSFTYHSLIYSCFYSKKTKAIKYGNVWFNNVHGVLPGVNKAVYNNNVIAFYDPASIDYYHKNYTYPLEKSKIDSFISEINTYFFNGHPGNAANTITSADYQFSKSELDDLQTIKASDNPVLLIQKLKDF